MRNSKNLENACGLICLSLSFYFFGFIIENIFPGYNVYKIFFVNLSFVIASIFGVSVVWELSSKEKFSYFLLELFEIKENLARSGIVRVWSDFRDLSWGSELKNARKLVIFVVYANTWRKNNIAHLKNIIDTGGEIQVVLPNFRNPVIMNELDRRFKYGEYATTSVYKNKNIKEVIEEAAYEFKELGANIMLYDRTLLNSYYAIDETTIIYAPFKHAAEKKNVPALKIEKGGDLYDFCKSDFDSIIKESFVYEYKKPQEDKS